MFTWSTHRHNVLVAARLDRALASQGFLNLWVEVELLVLPMICSDHRSIRLRTSRGEPYAPRPFRFWNMWRKHAAFLPFV